MPVVYPTQLNVQNNSAKYRYNNANWSLKTSIKTHGSVTKKTSAPHREYIDNKKENSFFMHASPWPLLQSTPFLHYRCPPGRVVHHTANVIKFTTAICKIWVFKVLFSSFFLLVPYRGYGGFNFFLYTLQKLL